MTDDVRGLIERIPVAIKATEYKYFGDYEMSDDQRDAVDVLVAAAAALEVSLAREEVLRAALDADCTRFPAMEAKLIEIANRISGMRGEPPCHPDPVILSEWVAEINRAALSETSQ